MMSPGIRPGDLPPFPHLGEYVFQELCRDLLDAEPDTATCEIYGERGQKQDGIDLRAYRKEGNGIVLGQCKCYRDFPPAEIRQASEDFLVPWRAPRQGAQPAAPVRTGRVPGDSQRGCEGRSTVVRRV